MARSAAAKATRPFDFVDAVPVSRLFLALNNPRFEEVESESEAIERLCSKEDVLPLARDIVRHGLSPLEELALTPVGKTRGGDTTYWVAEGNRRICALKLLADPDLAPPRLRKGFERLAESWTPIKTVRATVFNDADVLRVWLDRVHNGPQGGIGRRSWDAEQKQRFSGGSKNKLGQAILDYAEAEGLISKDERAGKLTTAQRFVEKEAFQEVVGIDRSSPEELSRTRPKADFDRLLGRFMRDLVEGTKVTSRMNKPDVVRYARTLSSTKDISGVRIEAEPITGVAAPKGRRTRRKPKQPGRAHRVRWDDEIGSELAQLGNEKLASLYYSICSVDLDPHTPLVAIGAWAFFETLTANAGRKDGVPFGAFLSKQKLISLGVGDADQKAVRAALERTADYGNQTKHHRISATFNGEQLNNDMLTLREVVLSLVREAT